MCARAPGKGRRVGSSQGEESGNEPGKAESVTVCIRHPRTPNAKLRGVSLGGAATLTSPIGAPHVSAGGGSAAVSKSSVQFGSAWPLASCLASPS